MKKRLLDYPPRECYDFAVERAGWKKDRKRLKKFRAWEERQGYDRDYRQAFRMIGEYVRFYLSRHSRRTESPDVSGIEKMRQILSRLS